MTHQEQWRPVVGYEGLYEVSDLGHVRSLDRTVRSPNRWGGVTEYRRPGRVLAPKHKTVGTHRYAIVTLSRDGVPTTRSVHVLVLEAWVSPRPAGAWGRHGPAGLGDNGRVNLSWGTPAENAQDRIRDGNDAKKNATHCPWGHRLHTPNLVPDQEVRRCRACACTQMWGHGRGLRPGDAPWLAEAHRRYDEILHFGHPLDYRSAPHAGRPRWTPGVAA